MRNKAIAAFISTIIIAVCLSGAFVSAEKKIEKCGSGELTLEASGKVKCVKKNEYDNFKKAVKEKHEKAKKKGYDFEHPHDFNDFLMIVNENLENGDIVIEKNITKQKLHDELLKLLN